MIDNQSYIAQSLELHLFFGRIMKEHAIFLEAGFLEHNNDYIKEADHYKKQFEYILLDTVRMSQGFIHENVLKSGELLTPYTLEAEKKTMELSGIKIDTDITKLTSQLLDIGSPLITSDTIARVKHLNRSTNKILSGLIGFKKRILAEVSNCKLFTQNYPLLIEHILREAELYQSSILALECGQSPAVTTLKQQESFWNQIMLEHALFIRGLLDPSENELILTANNFASDFRNLLIQSTEAIDKTFDLTVKFRNFKMAGTEGISNCKIKSIIFPLLADHVLREANHYIRILSS